MPYTEERDIQKDVTLNRFRLEKCSEEQPAVFHYWAEKEAEIKAAKDKADNRLDLIKAEVELEIRNNGGEKYGKLTEAKVVAIIETNPDVIKAKKELVEVKEQANLVSAAVRAMEHRKDQIENLTRLWIGSYYARPEVTAKDTFSNEVRGNLNKK